MTLYQNKYRVESTRLPGWDYASPAAYFITIITANREPYFGRIQPRGYGGRNAMHGGGRDAMHGVSTTTIGQWENANAEMILTEIGKIAENEWLKTPAVRPDLNLALGNFVVMPNHIHGIIIIGSNDYNRPDGGGSRDAMHGSSRDAMHGVSAAANHSNKFGPQRKNLGSIIRGYKSSVTTYARKNNIIFGWQERFHDRIIRNEQEFFRISNYIESNVKNWMKNDFFY